jgi:hypothetical protein
LLTECRCWWVQQALRLVRKYYDAGEESDENWHKKMKKIYTFCHQLITALAKVGEVNLALRLYLQTALAADYTQYEGSENIVYEFVIQAFSLYGYSHTTHAFTTLLPALPCSQYPQGIGLKASHTPTMQV